MTKKQTKILLLFSQYYSLREIAVELGICIGTLKAHLNNIKVRYPNYYDNALSMRESVKRDKYNLAHPFPNIPNEDNIKQVF